MGVMADRALMPPNGLQASAGAGPVAGQVHDGTTPREKGKVPNRRPDRMWGGPSSGSKCAICEAPLTRAEFELEIEYARNGDGSALDTYHVHIPCFVAWERDLVEPQKGDEGLVLTRPVSDGMITNGDSGNASKPGPA